MNQKIGVMKNAIVLFVLVAAVNSQTFDFSFENEEAGEQCMEIGCVGNDYLITCVGNQYQVVNCADNLAGGCCRNNQCTAMGCSSSGMNQFVCAAKGIFPDYYNCIIYHKCNESLGDTTHLCRNGYYFDADKMKCEMLNDVTKDCWNTQPPDMTCDEKNHGYQGTVYYKCFPNNTYSFYECAANFVFNTDSGMCQFFCPQKGVFPNSENCRSYFNCMSEGLNGIEIPCSNGLAFDPVSQECVNEAEVSGCSSSTSTSTTSTSTSTPTSPCPENCPANGGFIQNPSDCYSYCSCILNTITGKYSKKPENCNSGFYFNNQKRTCSPGSCTN